MTDTRAVDAALPQRPHAWPRPPAHSPRRALSAAQPGLYVNVFVPRDRDCGAANVQIARRMRAMMDTEGLGGSSATRLAGRI